jgi:hypothetical protein
MKQEVSQLLVSLEKFSTTENLHLYVPSLGRPVNFSFLTIKQQKDILKSAFDAKTGIFQFIETYNKILDEICKEKIPLNIIDKASISLYLKQRFFQGKCFGKLNGEDTEIDLAAHIESLPFVKIPNELLSKSITVGPITVECSIPLLSYEAAISSESKSILQELLKDKKDENLQDIIGEIYIFEILKFLKNIKYTFNNEPVNIDLTTLPLKEKASIFENLPLTLNNQILDYIKSIRNLEKPYLQVGDVSITIDPVFFNKTE